MKKCCKKWKEAKEIRIIYPGGFTYNIVRGCIVNKNDIHLCPECGSSLKEEVSLESMIIKYFNTTPKQESKREIDKELLEILRWFAGKIRYLSADVDIGESITEKEFWEAVTKYSEEVNITMQKRKSK
ncbi:hypothetical protein LCGC14_0399050 [marine sediment metagenome]|uniref:Uncharacterized protein n=1 Tax=marine sediment metagenome TaxID=412755 RepID=A0A0F9T2X7_9ZZZZ|nr:hypothetical protein [Candidatus Aminicenantes bacterium]